MFGVKMERKEKAAVYEKMMEELMNAYIGIDMIEQVMNVDALDKPSMPKRYRLIALGFMKQETLEDLNDNLINNGCQPLYSRSSFEVTLIFAFANQLSYQEWKRIVLACEKARDQWRESQGELEDNVFLQGKQISFQDLEQYVLNYSEKRDQELVTKQITRVLEESICSLGSNYNKFFQFYISNLQEFTDVREKSRYYFCKYLYYHLLAKIDKYKKRVGENVPSQEDLLSLLPLKVESSLRRKKTPSNQLLPVLRNCVISPAAIFEEFNYHYFEYVSLSWVELMLENVSEVNDLSDEQICMVADYLRKNIYKKEREKVGDLDDHKLVQDYIGRLQKNDEEMSVSRKGENAIRKYLRGDLDIDRTTLICFLLFWGADIENRNEIKISEKKINDILDECGFAMLRRTECFDHFVIHYMKNKDPVSYLMEEMDAYLKRGEPFLLYEVYANSSSNAKEIRRQMLLRTKKQNGKSRDL